jgi:hypothetical protein
MYIERELITNTKVNKNNRRYPIEVIEKIRDRINSNDEWTNLGILGMPESEVITLGQVAFKYSNAIIEDESLYCDIEVIDTRRGDELKQILGYEVDGLKRIVFRTSGKGSFKGGPIEETRNLLNIPNTVSDDFELNV